MGSKTAGTDRDKKKKIKWRPRGCRRGEPARGQGVRRGISSELHTLIFSKLPDIMLENIFVYTFSLNQLMLC